MFELIYQEQGSRKRQLKVSADNCVIGSGRQSDLVLGNRQISKRHALIYQDAAGIKIEDLGSMTGTWVNRERVITYGPLVENDEIAIGNVRLWVVSEKAIEPVAAMAVGSMHSGQPQSIERTLINRPKHSDDELLYWGKIAHDHLIAEMDLRRKDVHSMSDHQLRAEAAELLEGVLRRLKSDLPAGLDIEKLRANVLNEAVGLGPLEYFLDDPTITEIMVNTHDEIFIERNGVLEASDFAFSGPHAVLSVIERIITPLGRRIDESSPMVDARLKDGSRVNAIIPPLALKGPSVTIRKFAQKRLQFSDLIEYGSVSQPMVDFLRICVQCRKNIIVSGGTGSGKTTLLNVLSNFIPDGERIVTIEDAAELRLTQPNLVQLEARPPNLEGRGQISIRDLVRNSLRMRPDRIVVGECRGGEALDMLQAMNTGHDGSLTTIHANSPRDVLSRLEVMVLMAGMELPVSAIREQVVAAVDIIVQQTRFPCGSRKITRISEVVGIESGTVQLQDIFTYKQEGLNSDGKVKGRYKPTGFIPAFYEKLAESGVESDISIFYDKGFVS